MYVEMYINSIVKTRSATNRKLLKTTGGYPSHIKWLD